MQGFVNHAYFGSVHTTDLRPAGCTLGAHGSFAADKDPSSFRPQEKEDGSYVLRPSPHDVVAKNASPVQWRAAVTGATSRAGFTSSEDVRNVLGEECQRAARGRPHREH